MSVRPNNPRHHDDAAVAARRTMRALAWWLMIWLTLAGAGGCGGCRPLARRPPPDPDKPLVEKPKPKPDFELQRLSTLPHAQTVEARVKPGHWTAASLDAAAHNFDYQADLHVDGCDLPGVPYRLELSRPAAMPKGQVKQFELAFFTPDAPQPDLAGLPDLGVRLTPRGRPRSVLREAFPVRKLLPHQFYFFVLARDPDRYQYLRALDTFVPRAEEIFDPVDATHYFVLAPQIEQRTPLPSHVLQWTTLAGMLWDDQEPAALSPLQQQALVDWLHFGGQLVINGPATLDLLAGRFLAPLLPATGGTVRELSADNLDELNAVWSFENAPLRMSKPWSAVTLLPHAESRVLVAGGQQPLVVERAVGRGRIVVTAFNLAQRELLAWSGLDGFWNGCLLRRPKRVYRPGSDGLTRIYWSDAVGANSHANIPRKISQLRLFTRDAVDDRAVAVPAPVPAPYDMPSVAAWINPAPQAAEFEHGQSIGPPVAQWNDTGPVATAAAQMLRQAAGIDIPDQRFVLKLLGGYLLVIVPVNWLVFRLLGRLEWAWAAVPALALGGAVVVTRLAQLDIGFVRARTELGFVEMHGLHPRAHVTRYTALYTSLTTNYTVQFDEPWGAALPLATGQSMLRGQGRKTLDLRREKNAALHGFSVVSNSLGMLHSEHMQDLGGAFELAADGGKVTNQTELDLQAACVMRGSDVAWLGPLGPGQSMAVEYVARGTEPEVVMRLLGRNADSGSGQSGAAVPPLELAPVLPALWRELPKEEICLVGWTAAPLEGMAFEPAAPQQRVANVVIAHLRSAPPPALERDVNARPAVNERPAALEPPLPLDTPAAQTP